MNVRSRTASILLKALGLFAIGFAALWFLCVRAWQASTLHRSGRMWCVMLERFRCQTGRWPRDRKEFTESLSDDGSNAMWEAEELDASWTPHGDKLEVRFRTHWMWPPMEQRHSVVYDRSIEQRRSDSPRFFKHP